LVSFIDKLLVTDLWYCV